VQSRLIRWSALAVAIGGLAWMVKAAVIALRESSFEPLESVVFVGGLVAQVAGGAGLAAYVARRASGAAARAGIFLAVFAGLSIGSVLLSAGAEAVVDRVYEGRNQGLDEEAGIFVAGAAWLAIGGVLLAASRAAAGRRRIGDPVAAGYRAREAP
jgi:hypothetical protein